MYHLHTLRHMSYVYLQIFLTRQDNTSTIETTFLWSRCGRVVQGAGHQVKRLVLQCINAVSSNPVEGRTKIVQLKNLILTLFGLIFRRIYIYIYIYEGVMVLLCLTPFSTTFQLYRGCQFYWWRKQKYPEKTTDLPKVTDKRYYTIITLVGV